MSNHFDVKQYKQSSKNGGVSLAKIAAKFSKLTTNDENRRKVEHFLLDMYKFLHETRYLAQQGMVNLQASPDYIAYDENTGRVNLKKFDLMTTKKELAEKAEYSRIKPSENAWFHPPEVSVINQKNFDKIAYESESNGDKDRELISRYRVIFYQDMDTIQSYLRDENENITNIMKRLMNDYVRSFQGVYPRDGGYERLIDKCLMTVDNYGLGLGLFSILKASKHLIDEKLFNAFKRLFINMSNFNVFQRPTPEEAFDRYKMIIVFTGLLDKYNMHIGDDELLEKGTEKKAEEKEIAKLPKATKKAIIELVEECADGKERNPKTRRCVDKCKEGHSRDAEFKCKKNKTQKNKKVSKSVEIAKEKSPENKPSQEKKCADDKELNPKTNRCVNKCKNGYARDADFNCKKTK